MEKRCKRVSGINELGACNPVACAMNASFSRRGIPESDFVDFRRLMSHDLALQVHVAKKVERSRLDAVSTTSHGRNFSVVDVLDAVAPSGQADSEQEAHWTCANDGNVVISRRSRHCCRSTGINNEREKRFNEEVEGMTQFRHKEDVMGCLSR